MTMISYPYYYIVSYFFFNDTATTEIYTLSLHDALPIFDDAGGRRSGARRGTGPHSLEVGPDQRVVQATEGRHRVRAHRSEEHTSELQSRQYLVCRLLLEKKKKTTYSIIVRIFYVLVFN